MKVYVGKAEPVGVTYKVVGEEVVVGELSLVLSIQDFEVHIEIQSRRVGFLADVGT